MPYNNPSFPASLWNGLTKNPDRVDRNSNVDPNSDDWERIAPEVMAIQQYLIGQSGEEGDKTDSGVEFTGGFVERQSGTAGVSNTGDNITYTTAQAEARTWRTFGLSSAAQAANDNIYWSDPDTTQVAGYDATKGLFGGTQLPVGVSKLFDFNSTALNAGGTLTGSGDPWTASTGSLFMEEVQLGAKLELRFDFNVRPSIGNSTLEIGLIWMERDADKNQISVIELPGQPIFFGTSTVGNTYLVRHPMTAYFAHVGDLNVAALPAIRCNNQTEIQPISMLCSIQR